MPAGVSGTIEAAIAERQRSGDGKTLDATIVSSGPGWRILDVICTCGKHDIVRDEQHSHFSLAMVLGGAFEYRSRRGSAQLAPGSILLGQAGDPFRCWHSYGAGDRCLAVQFEAHAFEELTAHMLREGNSLPVALPVTKSTAGLFAFAEIVAETGLNNMDGFDTAVRLADRILFESSYLQPAKAPDHYHARRILELARWIETDPAGQHDIETLAQCAGLSKYHFIRSFRKSIGTSPYAFVTRARLRNASKEIAFTSRRITDIAMETGFSDLSAFNHLFKTHFGTSPRRLRENARKGEAHALFELERTARRS